MSGVIDKKNKKPIDKKSTNIIKIVLIIIALFVIIIGIALALYFTKTWPFNTYTKMNQKIGKHLPCPGKNVLPGTDPKIYCMVKETEAPAICDSMPGCYGYGVTTNAAHRLKYPDAAQLTSGELIDNPEWATYVKKV